MSTSGAKDVYIFEDKIIGISQMVTLYMVFERSTNSQGIIYCIMVLVGQKNEEGLKIRQQINRTMTMEIL